MAFIPLGLSEVGPGTNTLAPDLAGILSGRSCGGAILTLLVLGTASPRAGVATLGAGSGRMVGARFGAIGFGTLPPLCFLLRA